MATKLFVGNLSFNTTEGDILDLFKQAAIHQLRTHHGQIYGQVPRICVRPDGHSEEANKAVTDFNGKNSTAGHSPSMKPVPVRNVPAATSAVRWWWRFGGGAVVAAAAAGSATSWWWRSRSSVGLVEPQESNYAKGVLRKQGALFLVGPPRRLPLAKGISFIATMRSHVSIITNCNHYCDPGNLTRS